MTAVLKPISTMPTSQGFTLIEVLVGVILLSIITTMVIPLGTMVESFKLDYFNHRLYASAALARSEAIKRGEFVSICQSNNGSVCSDEKNWAGGWVLFTNPNNNNSIDSNEQVIRIYDPMSTPVRINWSNGTRLTFSARGNPNAGGVFDLCPLGRSAAPHRQVSISRTGQIIKSSTTGDCYDP